LFDPQAPGFFDPAAVETELRRVAAICQGCRRCENLCPSFDVLFRAPDRPEAGGEVGELPGGDLEDFSRLCYECRLCASHCPYVPPHPWDVDVPRLILRDRAAGVRHEGKLPLRERVLASVDAVGKVASAGAPVVNSLNESHTLRVLLEKALGVHRDRLLPTYAGETFSSWWERRSGATEPSAGRSGDGRVAVFVTCSANFHTPEVARAAVAVLEKNGCEVVVPPQRCCGMPFLESGDIDGARECRFANVNALSPFARAGYTVVALGPTCSLTLRKEYPLLGRDEEGRLVSEAIRDIGEYLMHRHSQGKLSLDFRRSPGRVLYQVACHLKVQDIGFPSRDLLKLIPGAEVETLEKCTGHDGTWSMKTEFFPLSIEVGRPVFEDVKTRRPDAIASDCSLARLQIRQGTGRTAKHPIQILAEAYELSY